MWNVGEEFVTSFDKCAAAQSVAFLPDGTRFITMSKSCSVQIWDMTSNVPSSKFSAVERTVSQRNQFVISPNGTRSILGSHLWDIVNGQQLVSLPHRCIRYKILTRWRTHRIHHKNLHFQLFGTGAYTFSMLPPEQSYINPIASATFYVFLSRLTQLDSSVWPSMVPFTPYVCLLPLIPRS